MVKIKMAYSYHCKWGTTLREEPLTGINYHGKKLSHFSRFWPKLATVYSVKFFKMWNSRNLNRAFWIAQLNCATNLFCVSIAIRQLETDLRHFWALILSAEPSACRGCWFNHIDAFNSLIKAQKCLPSVSSWRFAINTHNRFVAQFTSEEICYRPTYQSTKAVKTTVTGQAFTRKVLLLHLIYASSSCSILS